MPNYKVSGIVGEACDIRLMKGNSFLGYRESVSAGAYNIVFELDSIENVDVIAVRPDGKIVGYGDITPVSTVNSVNISIPIPASSSDLYRVLKTDLPQTYWQDYTYTLPKSYDWTKSVIIVNQTGNGRDTFAVYSVSSNHVTFRRWPDMGCHYDLVFSVLTLDNVKSLQRGCPRAPTLTVTDSNINISPVNTNKSIIIIGGFCGDESDSRLPYAYFNSSSQIRVNFYKYSDHYQYCYTTWQVVEFN